MSADDRHGLDIPPWLKALAGPFRRKAALAIALGTAAAGFSALLMFVSGYLVSKTAQSGTTLFMVMVPVAFVQVFGIGRPIARYFERLIGHDWVLRVTSSLRLRLFERIAGQAIGPAAGMAAGEQLELLSDDIGHLQNLFLRTALPIVVALAVYVLAGLFCGFFALELAFAIFAFGAVSAIALPLAAYALARPGVGRVKAMRSHEYARLADDVLGATDWALSGRGADARSAHERSCGRVAAGSAATRRLVRIAECAAGITLALGIVALTLVAAACCQQEGDAANLMAAFALGAFPLIETFTLLPQALVGSIEHESSIRHLDSRLGGEGPRRNAEPGSGERRGGADALTFENVSYRHPGAKRPALRNVSFAVPQGQTVAILGKSGSGKTTLASLARGALMPTEGTVLVHGRPAGSDAASDIAYIPHEPYVFDRTLRENLALADADATDERMERALSMVGLQGKFASLAHGLDEHVGETGTGFSGGEAHRLALARALLSDKPVVLLDEPFAGIDPTTERQLIATLFQAFEGRTLIVITHHLTQIERYDRVMLIEDGGVKLDGPPRDLARDEPSFERLLRFDRAMG